MEIIPIRVQILAFRFRVVGHAGRGCDAGVSGSGATTPAGPRR